MLTLDISDQPDVSLIVADTITLHVSSDKLKAIRAFERSFDPGPPGFKEGEEFKAHRESSSPELCKQKLPEGNPDGMRCPALALHSRNSDIVDALRESDASGPESPELKGLQSFATTVDFYQCVEVVRDAAPISGEEVSSYPHLVLLSVYLLDHAEQFTRLADHISKYEDHLVMADLKREAGLSHAGKELHFLLYHSRQRLHDLLIRDVSHTVALISFLFDDKYDHTRNQHEKPGPEDPCSMHRLVAMKCLKELARKKVWYFDITKPQPTTKDLICDILSLDNLPEGTQLVQSSSCLIAHQLLQGFDKRVRKLKSIAENTWAGICLPCLKGSYGAETCGHAKTVAKAPR